MPPPYNFSDARRIFGEQLVEHYKLSRSETYYELTLSKCCGVVVHSGLGITIQWQSKKDINSNRLVINVEIRYKKVSRKRNLNMTGRI